MRRRYWTNSASATVMALWLTAVGALAQSATDPELDIPLPEQPELILPNDEEQAPNQEEPPATSEGTRTDEAAAATEATESGLVTGTVAPTAQPQTPTATPEPLADAAAIAADKLVILDIPAVELPPRDPALTPPPPKTEPLRTAEPTAPSVEPAAPSSEQPKIVAENPVTPALAAAIMARAPDALALPRLTERERGEILAAYQAAENRPFWIEGKGWSKAGEQLAAQLSRAGEDGLRPTDYPLPVFEASDLVRLAEADIRLSALAVLYARDARGARIDPRRLSRLITPTLYLPSATEVLSELAGASDPGKVLAAYNPPHEGYRRLKTKLAELREHQDDTPMVRIPAGPALKLGMRDERVHLIRARLGLGPSDEAVFDRSTATALAEFQKHAGLPANGVLGAQTVAALGTPVTTRAQQDIIAQMERWRWLPPDLGQTHIWVNVPEYELRVMRDGKEAHHTRVIVGRPETATPIFSHRMDHVIVNPSWFVPPSILRKEFLPGLAADPEYAAKRGYVVTRRGNAITVRQPPGDRNALGWIKFMFPNDHSVYLHDTPNRRLFAAEKRAFSHGCVRVDQPFSLAQDVLGSEWTSERLKRLIGSGERTIKLPEQLAIHLVYNTHIVGPDGKLTVHDDIYGFHRLVRQALDQLS